MLQTVGSVVDESSCVPGRKLRMDNYTDLMGKERCWRVN